MRVNKLIILILAKAVLHANIAYSQDVLTWPECARIARQNNPDLISAYENVRQAKADKDVDVSAMLPQVDSELDVGRSKTGDNKPANSSSYGITGKQLVFDGFKTSSEVASSYKTIQAEQYNYQVTSSNVRLGLRNAFVGLLKAQELVFITEDIAERRRQNLDLVKLRYEGGRENKGSLLTAEADLAQAEFEITQAHRDIALSRRQLSKALGLNKMKPVKASGEFSLIETYDAKPGLSLDAYNKLKRNGVFVSPDTPGRLLHVKAVVIDSKYVFTGSANWTKAAMSDNYEATVFVESEADALELTRFIESALPQERPARIQSGVALPADFLLSPRGGRVLVKRFADRQFNLYLLLAKTYAETGKSTFRVDDEALAREMGYRPPADLGSYKSERGFYYDTMRQLLKGLRRNGFIVYNDNVVTLRNWVVDPGSARTTTEVLIPLEYLGVRL